MVELATCISNSSSVITVICSVIEPPGGEGETDSYTVPSLGPLHLSRSICKHNTRTLPDQVIHYLNYEQCKLVQYLQ